MPAVKRSGHVQALLEQARQLPVSLADDSEAVIERPVPDSTQTCERSPRSLDGVVSVAVAHRSKWDEELVCAKVLCGAGFCVPAVLHRLSGRNAVADKECRFADAAFAWLEVPDFSGGASQYVQLRIADLTKLRDWFRGSAGDDTMVWVLEVGLGQAMVGAVERRFRTILADATIAAARPRSVEQLQGLSYEELFDWTGDEEHWGGVTALAAACKVFGRNMQTWISSRPAEWSGPDVVENSEDRLRQLRLSKEAIRETARTPKASPSSPVRSQPPSVPEWPSDAQLPGSQALGSDCFWCQKGVLSFLRYCVGRKSTLSMAL